MSSDFSAIGTIDPESAVLLLGSAFSSEATNILGDPPPGGTKLREYLLNELGLPLDNNDDFQFLAEEFVDRDPDRMRSKLYNLFRISKCGLNQKEILSENWFRIYTTNYDDSVECERLRKKAPLFSYDISDKIPNKFNRNSIVHLHGSVRNFTSNDIVSNLVLSETSYVRQHLERSPWYNQFQADIRFASRLFVVGYSMSDRHISALLLQNPELAEKTFFIQSSDYNETFVRRTRKYGSSLFVGLNGFAQAIRTLPRPNPISDVTRLRNFSFLDPQRDKKGLRAVPESLNLH